MGIVAVVCQLVREGLSRKLTHLNRHLKKVRLEPASLWGRRVFYVVWVEQEGHRRYFGAMLDVIVGNEIRYLGQGQSMYRHI